MVGAARDLAKARRALAEAVSQQANNPPVEIVEADLASLKSVRNAASELLARAKPFDVIIANAGVMACPQGNTQDGFENAIRRQSSRALRVRQSARGASQAGRPNRHALGMTQKRVFTSLLWGHVEVIIGCIRDSRLLASVRCFATVSGGFTTFRPQALDARNVLHHTVTGVTGRGQQ